MANRTTLHGLSCTDLLAPLLYPLLLSHYPTRLGAAHNALDDASAAVAAVSVARNSSSDDIPTYEGDIGRPTSFISGAIR
jgi:hypothetical protein